MSFRILALSGGGYLGLYTASVLAELEERCGAPLHQRFDLVAGTSVGGILALAIASGKTSMREVVELMSTRGSEIFGSDDPPNGTTAKYWDHWKHRGKARYDPEPLRELITECVGADTYIADLKQKVVVPAVNVTKGSPQVFKTPHHDSLLRDFKVPLVDVALATSAAPTFFPLHTIGSERFTDGGVYANSPDEIALHEATHFLGQEIGDVHVLSVGTTTAKFSFSGKLDSDMGLFDWLNDQRLISVMIASQQMNTDFTMRHRLEGRYIRIDEAPSVYQLPDMRLDNASKDVTKDLLGLAEGSVRQFLPSVAKAGFLTHQAGEEDFLQRAVVAKYFKELRG